MSNELGLGLRKTLHTVFKKRMYKISGSNDLKLIEIMYPLNRDSLNNDSFIVLLIDSRCSIKANF